MTSDVILSRGPLVARKATSEADIQSVQALRYRAFVDPDGQGVEGDSFDDACEQVLIELKGRPVATFRYQVFENMAAAQAGYTGARYDLEPLLGLAGAGVELGRFCLAPDYHEPDALRLAWGVLTQVVDRNRASLLFGCSSLPGTDPTPYHDAFALLRAKHLGPDDLRPRAKSDDTVTFSDQEPNVSRGQDSLSPLLRTYLMMGGWVTDHAVVDREMNTLHVFTAVEVAKIPPGRAKLLRVLAGD